MVNKEIFLENFRELFEETDPQEIQLDTKFKELDEWSSLIVLSLIVHFEDNYQFKISPKQIEESTTIDDLYKLVG